MYHDLQAKLARPPEQIRVKRFRRGGGVAYGSAYPGEGRHPGEDRQERRCLPWRGPARERRCLLTAATALTTWPVLSDALRRSPRPAPQGAPESSLCRGSSVPLGPAPRWAQSLPSCPAPSIWPSVPARALRSVMHCSRLIRSRPRGPSRIAVSSCAQRPIFRSIRPTLKAQTKSTSLPFVFAPSGLASQHALHQAQAPSALAPHHETLHATFYSGCKRACMRP